MLRQNLAVITNSADTSLERAIYAYRAQTSRDPLRDMIAVAVNGKPSPLSQRHALTFERTAGQKIVERLLQLPMGADEQAELAKVAFPPYFLLCFR